MCTLARSRGSRQTEYLAIMVLKSLRLRPAGQLPPAVCLVSFAGRLRVFARRRGCEPGAQEVLTSDFVVMCGICGVWEYGASEGRVDPSLLARMRDEMTSSRSRRRRRLIFDDRRGGFGFRRLSIIDLSAAGHQPMHGCDERTWLVFNGEIYNHALTPRRSRKTRPQILLTHRLRNDPASLRRTRPRLHSRDRRRLRHRDLGREQRTTRARARSHRR